MPGVTVRGGNGVSSTDVGRSVEDGVMLGVIVGVGVRLGVRVGSGVVEILTCTI
jgi:hypothetical protein